MYLVFDTETTGLPKNYNAPVTEVENWPRMISLAWALYDEKGELIAEYHQLIRPDGWEVPKEDFWINNGYSTEKSLFQGVPVISALHLLITAVDQAEYLIAHNMSFDEKIIGAEMIRLGLKTNKKPIKICTKEASVDYCQIPGKLNFKWPKLTELHFKLFGCDFESAHDAMNDVKACAKCFFELLKLEIIKL